LENKVIKKNTKTVVFIDAANIIYGARDGGWKMDFKKLIKYLKERFGARKVFYYAGLDSSNKKQLEFYEILQKYGYSLRLVPVKTFRDGRKKADVDSRMTFEMMKYLPKYTHVIAMTGDGDFYWLFEYLMKISKRVKLIAHRKSTAQELKKLFGSEFTDLSRMKNMLKFDQKNAADAFKGSTARGYRQMLSKGRKNVKKK